MYCKQLNIKAMNIERIKELLEAKDVEVFEGDNYNTYKVVTNATITTYKLKLMNITEFSISALSTGGLYLVFVEYK